MTTSTTIVTCYYKIKSKHPPEHYDQWIANFLSTVQTNTVLFTSHDLQNTLYDKCSEILKTRIKIIPLSLDDLPLAQKYKTLWDRQYEMDRQKYSGRTKECYILWNSKLWFLMQAINENPFQSDKFVWTDIGCLRNINSEIRTKLQKYPLYDNISETQLDIVLLSPFKQPKLFFQYEVHFSGAMFGGHTRVIKKVYDLFYERLDMFIQEGLFVGCDQQTMASVFMTNPEVFHPIIPSHDTWIDPWFYLWDYYSLL
jgi:hypothetical protein